MTAESKERKEWERLLRAERRLQTIVPECVLVGGTAAALHAGHRISLDGDHVLSDLKDRFDDVLARLEATPGWTTERFQKPVLILGSLDQALTGLRQLRRSRPLEVETRESLKVPTLPEMVRIKAWLFLTRDTSRDLLDTVALLDKLGDAGLEECLSSFDAIYERGLEGGPPLVELAGKMAAARPQDRGSVDLSTYKAVVPPWNDWTYLERRSRYWAGRVSGLALKPGKETP